MSNSKLSQISEQIKAEFESKGKYLKLEDGEARVLQFDPEQVKIVKKDFRGDGNIQTKVEYKVVDAQDKNASEKTLTMSLTTAQMIQKKLEKGQTLLEVERFGTGTKTTYSITAAQ